MRLLLAGLAALAAGCASAEDVKSIFPGADPDAMVADGRMWIYPTGSGNALSAWSSADMTKWQKQQPDLLRIADIPWVKADHALSHFLWAPDMVAAKDLYYLYYAVGPQDPTPSRLGVATCAKPGGPCVDSGAPLLTGGNGFEAIDPFVFADPKSGKTYLYAGGSNGAKLRVFELGTDMVTIQREDTIEQPPGFTEGAFLHERNGIYYLSYSHGRWNASDYSVHYAMAPTPLGPWKYRGPILQGDARYKGPGHHSFIQDPRDGSWLIVYHRWEGKRGDGPYGGDRHVAIQHITYRSNGEIEPIKMSD